MSLEGEGLQNKHLSQYLRMEQDKRIYLGNEAEKLKTFGGRNRPYTSLKEKNRLLLLRC